MGIDYKQYRTLIFLPALLSLAPEVPYSVEADFLVDETLWHESGRLIYVAQKLNGGLIGPGGGLGSMEEETFDWIYMKYYDLIRDRINWHPERPVPYQELYWNNKLSVIMTRLRYRVVADPLPRLSEGVEARAEYWGEFYQGKSDPVKMARYIADAQTIPRGMPLV